MTSLLSSSSSLILLLSFFSSIHNVFDFHPHDCDKLNVSGLELYSIPPRQPGESGGGVEGGALLPLMTIPLLVALPGEHHNLKYVSTFARSSIYPSPCFAIEARLNSSSGSELL